MVSPSVVTLLQDADRVAAVAAAAGLVAGAPPTAEPLGCVLTNLTTEDLARVQLGDAGSVVIKVAQSPRHSPVWASIPPAFHEQVMSELPWRAEADIYRSNLAALLPTELRMPAVYAVDELGEDRIAMWLEDVPDAPEPWARSDYVQAARALGSLAGRLPDGTIPDDVPVGVRDLRGYFFGRVTQGTLPVLDDDATWSHPLIAASVDDALRADLEHLATGAPRLLDQLDALPRTLAHGDACPQNLLRPPTEPGTLVAIDWTFAGICAVGMDGGQLLAGHAESGQLDPADLPDLLEAIIDGYATGLAGAGLSVDRDRVRFGVVANLVIRSAFTALPIEMLEAHGGDAQQLFARRARYARFLADLGLELARESVD